MEEVALSVANFHFEVVSQKRGSLPFSSKDLPFVWNYVLGTH